MLPGWEGLFGMNRIDWIFVGLKLLGAYFAVQGAVALIVIIGGTILSLQMQDVGQPVHAGNLLGMLSRLFYYLQPIVYFAGAFLLIRRTDGCLRWMCLENKLRPGHDGANQPIL